MRQEDVRRSSFYRILKAEAEQLLRDCDTAVEAQALGKELEEVFSAALIDTALEKWYGEG